MDAAIRGLLRTARRRAGLSQSQVADRAHVPAGWYKQVERATEVSVSLATLLEIFLAAGVAPASLRAVGHSELAGTLAETQQLLDGASPYTDELERYLWKAPADAALRLSLIAFSRTLRDMAEPGSQGEPFAEEFLRTRRQR